MGVTGLWTVVQPCARPIKIETLNRKRLAVDASIWIYQFLKAVRDKEGNALRNSHVVGFFRRICKLLFIGIKPVFVFDGGAPILKRQTVSSRKARREGRREDAVRTAGKLLAVQMQRRAEEDENKRREERDRPRQIQEEELPENLVYVDELQMTPQERQQNRTFRKKDAYHLPNLDVDLADMGAPNDPRIMSHEELEEYARQFHTGEDVNIYDFSKIDFDSPFFVSLPAADRYNILNAARLRSRLRMGYSKEQLDTMFPNRMDFSRFQVERVRERNELTQRLMNLNGMNGEDAMSSINSGGRIAGEKGKEYVLVKNDGVEGGWALGVVSNKGEGERNKPINVEELDRKDLVEEADEEDDGWEDDGFEDVPIEGLNRLPKRSKAGLMPELDAEGLQRRREAVYKSRARPDTTRATADQDEEQDADSLFVPQFAGSEIATQSQENEELDDIFEDVEAPEADDEDLRLAIAMSLEGPNEENSAEDFEPPSFADSATAGPRIDRPLEFNKKNAKAGKDFAHLANARARQHAPRAFIESDEEDDLDLEAALIESRKTMHKPRSGPRVHGFKRPGPFSARPSAPKPQSDQVPNITPSQAPAIAPPEDNAGFSGPLPFESISLGKSILGQKKKKPAEAEAGGFQKEAEKEKKAQPLPPWFSGDIREGAAKQKAIEEKQFESSKSEKQGLASFDQGILQRQESGEVIDLEALEEKEPEVVVVNEVDEDVDQSDEGTPEPVSLDPEVRMGDVAELVRVEPPTSAAPSNRLGESGKVQSKPSPKESAEDKAELSDGALDWSESEAEAEASDAPEPAQDNASIEVLEPTQDNASIKAPGASEDNASIAAPEISKDNASIEAPEASKENASIEPPTSRQASRSLSPEFEDVTSADVLPDLQDDLPANADVPPPIPSLPVEKSIDGALMESYKDVDGEEGFSDPEDEELMRQMAIEAEEHARFAAELNSRSRVQTAEDYEKELKQLRNQQKKDRRDADEVTHIMVTECQQLLQLFGLPYITAPMEAEAQCAELVSLGLVDGIVTDDSDIFLFGGTRIYKNMFNQSKFVECYLASDLEKEYSLDRQKLIRFAHLLGSDYTEGLPSVGPVTALEILSEFETLEQFTEWWSTVQLGQPLSASDAANPFRRKFRKNASKIFLPNTFPDKRVDYAYLNPEVDSDPHPFQWGVPDLDRLRQFLMATIGWSQDRTDEVLVPVIRDMNRRENEGTQANITQFFGGSVGLGAKPGSGPGATGNNQSFAPRRRVEGKSRRMENALGRLHDRATDRALAARGEPEQRPGDMDVEPAQPEENGNGNGTPKSNGKQPAKRKVTRHQDDDGESDSSMLSDGSPKIPQKSRRLGRGGRKKIQSRK